jgi:hypothetical protein
MSRVIEVDLTDTLMILDSYLEAHVQSSARHSTYYFRVPNPWADLPGPQLNAQVMSIMLDIYNATNERLRSAEPNDPNYLAPIDVQCRTLTPEEEAQKRWLTAPSPAIWEWTPCVIVNDDGSYEKVDPQTF